MPRSRSRSRQRSAPRGRSRSGGRRDNYERSPERGGRGGDRSPPRGGGGGAPRNNDMRISLLVRNIADDTSPQELRDHFSKFGMIKDVYVPLDFHTRCVPARSPAPCGPPAPQKDVKEPWDPAAWAGTRLGNRIRALFSSMLVGLDGGAAGPALLVLRCSECFARSRNGTPFLRGE